MIEEKNVQNFFLHLPWKFQLASSKSETRNHDYMTKLKLYGTLLNMEVRRKIWRVDHYIQSDDFCQKPDQKISFLRSSRSDTKFSIWTWSFFFLVGNLNVIIFFPIQAHYCANIGGTPRYMIDNNPEFHKSQESLITQTKILRDKTMKLANEDKLKIEQYINEMN